MWATGSPRPNPVDLAWGAFAAANFVAMLRWESGETVPFHFIWGSLTLLYGFRVWNPLPTALVLLGVCASAAVLIVLDVHHGTQEWGELTEVPLMSAMFLAMVWHARRRQEAIRVAETIADNRARLLERQERFLHDVTHELQTPVTIARGHLELLEWEHPSSQARSTSSRASSASSTDCCCSRRPSGRTSSPFARSTSRHSSRMSSSAGRTSRRACGDWDMCREAPSAQTRRCCGPPSTHCSRTR